MSLLQGEGMITVMLHMTLSAINFVSEYLVCLVPSLFNVMTPISVPNSAPNSTPKSAPNSTPKSANFAVEFGTDFGPKICFLYLDPCAASLRKWTGNGVAFLTK